MEAQEKIQLITKNCVGLERHAYSPEQNKLHLSNDTTLKAPQQTDVNEAILYASKRITSDDLNNLLNIRL